MKVAPKLVLAVWVAFLPVLGLHGWLAVRREQDLFRSEMERGLSLLGEHLRQVLATEWDMQGPPEVRVLLAAAARTDRDVQIRWLPQAPPGAQRGLAPPARGRMTWLEPLTVDGRAVGAIEISESLAPMYRYVHATVLRIAMLSVALGLASMALARALGHRLIGRRLEVLVQFARRTGAGHLGDRVDLGGHDEVTTLAASLGDMSGQLAVALQETQAANAERLSMLQQLRHAERLTSIGRLASGVAHELGTPLNVATGHAQRIVKGCLAPDELQHSAEVIHRQMDRMAGTIRNVLGFVRRSPPRTDAIDLVRLVRAVRDLIAPLAAERQVELVASSGVPAAVVRGSEIQLEQALSNLIANAIDATEKGGRVEIEVERQEGRPRPGIAPRPMVAVRVRDHGSGVPVESIDRIFEPFFTSKPEGAGTGLGLWISQGIAQDHDGCIEVANPAGGGACFTLLIPELGEC